MACERASWWITAVGVVSQLYSLCSLAMAAVKRQCSSCKHCSIPLPTVIPFLPFNFLLPYCLSEDEDFFGIYLRKVIKILHILPDSNSAQSKAENFSWRSTLTHWRISRNSKFKWSKLEKSRFEYNSGPIWYINMPFSTQIRVYGSGKTHKIMTNSAPLCFLTENPRCWDRFISVELVGNISMKLLIFFGFKWKNVNLSNIFMEIFCFSETSSGKILISRKVFAGKTRTSTVK